MTATAPSFLTAAQQSAIMFCNRIVQAIDGTQAKSNEHIGKLKAARQCVLNSIAFIKTGVQSPDAVLSACKGEPSTAPIPAGFTCEPSKHPATSPAPATADAPQSRIEIAKQILADASDETITSGIVDPTPAHRISDETRQLFKDEWRKRTLSITDSPTNKGNEMSTTNTNDEFNQSPHRDDFIQAAAERGGDEKMARRIFERWKINANAGRISGSGRQVEVKSPVIAAALSFPPAHVPVSALADDDSLPLDMRAAAEFDASPRIQAEFLAMNRNKDRARNAYVKWRVNSEAGRVNKVQSHGAKTVTREMVKAAK